MYFLLSPAGLELWSCVFLMVIVRKEVTCKISWWFILCLTSSLFSWSFRHKRSKAHSRWKHLKIQLAESHSLWSLSMYELFLWVKGSTLVHWLTSLLAFLHWATSGHLTLPLYQQAATAGLHAVYDTVYCILRNFTHVPHTHTHTYSYYTLLSLSGDSLT